MPVQVTCQNCGKSIRASEKYAGKRVKCPGCGHGLYIPGSAEKQTPQKTEEKKQPEKTAGSVITANCGNCGRKINAPIKFAGRKVKCPSCGQSLRIPVSEKDAVISEEKKKAEKLSAKGIKAECKNCGRKINAPENYAGKRVKCPSCKDSLYIPFPDDRQQVTDIPQKADAEPENKPLTATVTEEKEPNQPAEDIPADGKAAKPEPAQTAPVRSGKKRKLILAASLAATLAAVLVLYFFIVKNPIGIQFADKILTEAGPKSPDQQLASLIKQGRYAEAMPVAEKILATTEKAAGSDHPDLENSLSSVNKLADIYRCLGNHNEAESLYKRVLSVREKILGPDHPDVAATLNSLAKLYKTLKKYDKAEALYKRVLAIKEKIYGPDHADTAKTLDNLGRVYISLKDYAKAEPLYKRALEIREKTLGPEHLYTATNIEVLARIYERLDSYGNPVTEKDPKSLYERAKFIRNKTLGDRSFLYPDIYEVMIIWSDQEILVEIAMNTSASSDIRKTAVNKLLEMHRGMRRWGRGSSNIPAMIDESDQKAWATNILGTDKADAYLKSDQNALGLIAINADSARDRSAALYYLTDQRALAIVAVNESYSDIRLDTMRRRLRDQRALAFVTINTFDRTILYQAVEKLTDQKAVADVALINADSMMADRVTDPQSLKFLALHGSWLIGARALKKTDDQKILSEIALNAFSPQVREAAAEYLTDQNYLADLAKNSDDRHIRGAAAKNLCDQNILAEIAMNDPSPEVRKTAAAELDVQEILANIARNASDPDIRKIVLDRLNAQNILAEIAVKDSDKAIRRKAVMRLSDHKILTDFANGSDGYLRDIASERLGDQSALAHTALNGSEKETRRNAAEKLTDQKTLADLALNAYDADIRKIAAERVNDQKVLAAVSQNDPEKDVRTLAITKVSDQKLLLYLAKNAADQDVRIAAAENLTDVSALSDLEQSASDIYVRNVAGLCRKFAESGITVEELQKESAGKIRAAVVRKLSDQEMLADLAQNDTDKYVREEALKKLTDQKTLADIAQNDSNPDIRKAALKKLTAQRFLSDILLDHYDSEVQNIVIEDLNDPKWLAYVAANISGTSFIYEAALKKLTDQKTLAEILQNGSFPDICETALKRFIEQGKLKTGNEQETSSEIIPERIRTLREVLRTMNDQAELIGHAYAPDTETRREVVKKITNQKWLFHIIKDNSDPEVCREAVNKVTDLELLTFIVKNDSRERVRTLAAERLTGQKILEITLKELNSQNDAVINARKAALEAFIKKEAFLIPGTVLKKNNQKTLIKAALSSDGTSESRLAAVEKLEDQDALALIAVKASDEIVRIAAVKKLTDHHALVQVFTHPSSDQEVRMIAEEKLK